MKLKLSKTSFLALFFIFLMVSSTVAYTVLQVFRPTEEEIQLPSGNIIDYELTTEQESYLLAQGKTIIKYEYELRCVECLSEKGLLEQFTRYFSNQLFLQEIVSDRKEVTITSRYGQKTPTNITQDEIFDDLCSLMTEPPVACIRRGV